MYDYWQSTNAYKVIEVKTHSFKYENPSVISSRHFGKLPILLFLYAAHRITCKCIWKQIGVPCLIDNTEEIVT